MANILAFESSCDETAVALFQADARQDINTPRLFHALHSQIALHAEYGGVVPELASRDHVKRIRALTSSVLEQASTSLNSVDVIAYTAGPGLAGALMVAASFAQTLAWSWKKVVLPIHHLEGHLLSPRLAGENHQPIPQFPYIALLVSGGHSQLYAIESAGHYRLLGESVDDAVGEAFDKSAKMMGLPYPGGQYLEQIASLCHEDSPKINRTLPRPMINSQDLMMSFSGLKTAVWHAIREVSDEQKPQKFPVIAREFQQAIVEVLIHKTLKACDQTGISRVAICGGVAKNQVLRDAFIKATSSKKIELFFTPMEFCTDNAAMIAMAASFHISRAKPAGAYAVYPHWTLEDALALITANS